MVTTIDTPRRMSCMEIWGGNTAVSDLFHTVGLELYVHSEPFQSSSIGGGDIYYVTSCASARITRLLLADVSGHGEAASDVAIRLRDLMRQHVNSIEQQSFVEQMNREFGASARDSAFATAVVATYFHPRRELSVALAGHPNPLQFDSRRRRWQRVVPADDGGREVSNIPLGLRDNVDYPSGEIRVVAGDMMLLYTDAFIEAELKDGSQLGLEGLVELMNQLQDEFDAQPTVDPTPQAIADRLLAEINRRSREAVNHDDATLILGRFTDQGTRFRDDAVAPIRMFGPVSDRTRIE